MLNRISPSIETVYHLPLGGVNAYLIDSEEELILIDTGNAGDHEKIKAALAEIGRTPGDLTHIILTHCHPDHAGSLADLQKETDAITIMHPLDAEIVRAGIGDRQMAATPGLMNAIIFRLTIQAALEDGGRIQPGRVDQHVEGGEVLPLGGGIRVIHAPGHSQGQIALLWEPGGVLFAADTVINIPWLKLFPGYENLEVGRRTAAKLAALEFEAAGFGHGNPISSGASARFKRAFLK